MARETEIRALCSLARLEGEHRASAEALVAALVRSDMSPADARPLIVTLTALLDDNETCSGRMPNLQPLQAMRLPEPVFTEARALVAARVLLATTTDDSNH